MNDLASLSVLKLLKSALLKAETYIPSIHFFTALLATSCETTSITAPAGPSNTMRCIVNHALTSHLRLAFFPSIIDAWLASDPYGVKLHRLHNGSPTAQCAKMKISQLASNDRERANAASTIKVVDSLCGRRERPVTTTANAADRSAPGDDILRLKSVLGQEHSPFSIPMSFAGQQRVWSYEERSAGQAGCSSSTPCCSGRSLSSISRRNVANAGRRSRSSNSLVHSLGGLKQSLICSVVQEETEVSFLQGCGCQQACKLWVFEDSEY